MKDRKRNIYILFATRSCRLFAYGFLSVMLILYLTKIGLSEYKIGLLITFTLLGDAIISLFITTHADTLSRKKMLIFGAILMAAAGMVFLLTNNYLLLVITGIIGVISPSGKEIGPFLSIEQSALAQIIETKKLIKTFAWYNLAGSFAGALGALCAGWILEILPQNGFSLIASFKVILAVYALIGLILAILFIFLSEQIEASGKRDYQPLKRTLGLHKSKKIIIKLSSLFALDAFAGGFIIQSIIAYWFFIKFDLNLGMLGNIFFALNIVSGISAIFAARLANRFGLINIMVITHLPSNILLLLIPLMPTLLLAILLLILRFSISQMDVPTRQVYTMAMVADDERSAASGITTITRSIGASLSPTISGLLLANPLLISFPFFFAGSIKIIYDLWLYVSFKKYEDNQQIKMSGT